MIFLGPPFFGDGGLEDGKISGEHRWIRSSGNGTEMEPIHQVPWEQSGWSASYSLGLFFWAVPSPALFWWMKSWETKGPRHKFCKPLQAQGGSAGSQGLVLLLWHSLRGTGFQVEKGGKVENQFPTWDLPRETKTNLAGNKPKWKSDRWVEMPLK